MENECSLSGYEGLSPDAVINAVEEAMKIPFGGHTATLPSYINRVYELEARDRTRYIAKFYRPGRWSRDALLDEHRFVLDCMEDEIPVIAPIRLPDGETLGRTPCGIYFAVYPKRWGRELEVDQDEEWIRLGQILARVHMAGSRGSAPARLRLHPEYSLRMDIDELLEGGMLTRMVLPEFQKLTDEIMTAACELDFDGTESIRIHGDCHRANILSRPDEGLMIIDFDDMMNGPPVQDLWLLLPGYAHECKREIDLILKGYGQFRTFDRRTLRFIEVLRAMRMIYFLAWCGRQRDDYQFPQHFPGWGTDIFWQRELGDFRKQLNVMRH